MTLTTRVLSEAEWPRLQATGCEVRKDYRDATSNGYVLVTENSEGEIVGTLWLTFSARLDGAWTRPDYRDGSVLRRLGHAAMTLAQQHGVTKVFAPVESVLLHDWLTTRFNATATAELILPVVRHG